METKIREYFKNPVTIWVAIIVVVGGYFLFTNSYPAVAGETYYLSNGDISLFFPEQPTYSLAQQELTKGNKVNIYSYSSSIGDTSSLNAGYIKSPFANSSLTPEENLQKELEFTANNGGSRLVSSKAATYKGYPSIDYVTYGQPDKSLPPMYQVGRDFLKDGDLYMLGYAYYTGNEDKSLQDKFLNSLSFGRAWNSKDVNLTGNTFYTKSDSTNVRECASSSCKVLTTYPANTSVYLQYASEDELPDWVPVTWQDDNGATKNGFVSKTTLVRKDAADVNSETATSNGTPCNGKYWGKCPAGQNFVCPATGGDAYCEAADQTQTSARPSNNTLTSVIEEWHPYIAYIVCNFTYSNGTPYSMQGSGTVSKSSGSIVIVTNKHVVTDINGYGASSCSAYFPLDPNRTPLTWTTNDYYIYPNLDFAYLPINNPTSYITNLANSVTNRCSVEPPLGEEIAILGYPTNGSKTDITATQGIISGYDGNYYVTSAKVNHGNSGGAAIDIKNDCYLGIPTYYEGDVESLPRILKWQSWSN
jgi:hypothetical protein